MSASPLTPERDLISAMKLQDRLQEVMSAMGWDHADVVRISGASSSVVSQWLGKGSKEIKSIGKVDYAINLERESGYSASWIARGVGPKAATPGRLNPPAKLSTPSVELSALYAAILAIISTHHDGAALLSAFDGVVSAMSAAGLPEETLAALQRFRALIAQRAAEGRLPNRS